MNHHQDDWFDWLPMCEFASNNAVSDTKQVSPLPANFGRDPRMNFDLELTIENPDQARAQEAAQNLQKIHDLVKAEMASAQNRHAEHYDKSRCPAPMFKLGDRV